MAENLLLRPKVSGVMRISPNYSGMGLGTTSRVALIGHADGLGINDPYQVNNMQEAVNVLLADGNSPLLRGLLEAYNNGCRDIWLIAAAPMSEYEPVVENRITGQFYVNYYNRLNTTYALLREYDFPEVIVPIEAVYYDSGGVDFLGQLAAHCEDAFAYSGAVQVGILGTRIPNTTTTENAITAMVNRSNSIVSTRPANMRTAGKYVMVVVGEGLVNFPQLNFSYSCPLAAQVAAAYATTSVGNGLTYAKLPTVVNITSRNYTDAELVSMTNAKLNPVIRTSRGKRGVPFRTVLLTDNTMGLQVSEAVGLRDTDFWSMAQMRLVATCINFIRVLGYSFIGKADSNNIPEFKQMVFDYLRNLVVVGAMKDFDLRIQRVTPSGEEIPDTGRAALDEKVMVEVGLWPYFGVRQIFFTCEVGPGV